MRFAYEDCGQFEIYLTYIISQAKCIISLQTPIHNWRIELIVGALDIRLLYLVAWYFRKKWTFKVDKASFFCVIVDGPLSSPLL